MAERSADRRRSASLAAAALAAAALLVVPRAGAAAPELPPVEELLARHAVAIGGEEAWGRLASARKRGTMGLGPEIEVPVTILAARPRRYRVEFVFKDALHVNAYDGQTGWYLMPAMFLTSPTRLPEGETRTLWELADFDGPLLNWRAEGTAVRLLGEEMLDGRPAYRLDLAFGNGERRELLLDAETALVARVEGSYEARGSRAHLATSYGDYRQVAGVRVPYRIEERVEGVDFVRVIRLDQVEFDVEIAGEVFAPPAVEERPEAPAPASPAPGKAPA